MMRCRPRHARVAGVAALLGYCCLLAAVAEGERLPARQTSTEDASLAPIWRGVYSEAQARRGLQEYARSCEHCHGASLTGNPTDEVPALVADGFLFHWRGRTVQDLLARVSRAMPADAPGSLDPRAYLDLVAFLLEANGFPAGPGDLDRNRVSTLVIEAGRPAPRRP